MVIFITLHYLGSKQQKRNAKHVQAYQHLIKTSHVFAQNQKRVR